MMERGTKDVEDRLKFLTWLLKDLWYDRIGEDVTSSTLTRNTGDLSESKLLLNPRIGYTEKWGRVETLKAVAAYNDLLVKGGMRIQGPAYMVLPEIAPYTSVARDRGKW
ncbi:hypothetical protein CVT25_005483 [Psilocybe cyanescens]|uniref:Uncharacterized protein n=1 Tax=Psilocybe cyanescens TaxID=93625 RepID=A0A409XS09_PSICY|nr:hypothetical protein CVT25_005483 [Psilocybe cyanescens]